MPKRAWARVVAAVAAIAVAMVGAAAATPSLSFTGRDAAHVGIVVRDLRSGAETVAVNPALALTPASITKCVTAASVVAAGLLDEAFTTPVYLTGSVEDGVLDGSVVIAGQGDPTTSITSFPRGAGLTDSIAAALRRRGITAIRGSLVADCAALPGEGPNSRWEIGDAEWSYGAGLYAVNYNGNTRGADRALPDPPEAFLAAAESALSAAGIAVEWPDEDEAEAPTASRAPLTAHTSATYETILRRMMTRSDNLFAEAMLRALVPGGTLKDALAKEKSLLGQLGLETSTVGLYDGSGLSRNDRFSPRFLSRLLAKMAARGDAGRYVALFPLAGKEGTVKQLLKGTRLAGRMALKSGSMMGVLCYAGYKLDEKGVPTHAVVVMANGFFCPAAEVRKAIQSFLLATF